MAGLEKVFIIICECFSGRSPGKRNTAGIFVLLPFPRELHTVSLYSTAVGFSLNSQPAAALEKTEECMTLVMQIYISFV